MNEALDILSQRLEHLERNYSRLKGVSGALLVVIVAILVTAQAAPKTRTLEAHQFYIRDELGKVRAALGVGVLLAEGKDAVGLRLVGRDGKTRLQLLLRGNDDAPFVQLRDHEEKVSAQIDLSVDDTPGLGLRASRRGLGAPTAEIGISFKNGLPYISLTNKDDKVIWKAP